MPDYDRFALVFDTTAGSLGQAAIRLIEVGIDVLYANDVDEAELLARQEAQRLGAVLIPADVEARIVDPLLARVCSQTDAGPEGLIVAGPAPSPEFAERLRFRDVVWCLREPYDLRELRFVMTAAMATAHGRERRKHLRIPTEMTTTVFMGRHRKEVTVHDLSVAGAYFATAHPFLPGSILSIDLPLPGGSVLGKAKVVSAKTDDSPGRPDVPDGMGVEFTALTPPDAERLARYVEDWIDRFRL